MRLGKTRVYALSLFALTAIALLWSGVLLRAQASPNTNPPSAESRPTHPEKWQVDDFIMTESASQFDISPDDKWAVWVKTVPDKGKDGRLSNLMLTSLTDKKEIELTRGKDSNTSPKWSPNGELIAFLSNRPDPMAKTQAPGDASEGPTTQLWLINPHGGEPWPLTSNRRSVIQFGWAGNDQIVFTSLEDNSQRESTLKEKKDTSIVVDDELHAIPTRLFRITIKEKTVERLTNDPSDRIENFAVSHDGTKVAAMIQRSLSYIFNQRVKPVPVLFDLKAHTRKQLFVGEKLNPVQFRWTLDDQGLYVVSHYSSDPVYLNATIARLYYFDIKSGRTVEVNLDWDKGLAGALEVTPDGFIGSLADGVRNKEARYVRNPNETTWTRTWLEGDPVGHIWQMTLSQDGKMMVYGYSTASTPVQFFRGVLKGNVISDPVQVTDLNAELKKRAIAKSEIVHWKGALDEEVEGLLYYPQNYEAGKKYPLMVMIHGGPAGADHDSWNQSFAYPVNLITERGAFVLRPNYHGSSNYGLRWVESIAHGKYYDLEIPDIEKGVDYLISRGLVDSDKLGTMGWSNGAILSIQLTVTTDRYKVCSAGAGDVDWTSDWGNAAFGASFDNYYFGKSPLEDPELYRRKSPFFQMDRVKTPTIIFFGTVDTNVPTEQGWLHYRALQELGKTDVKFILFPGEPHGPQKLSHQRRKLEEDLAWIDKYLFKTVQPANEALKPGSPLAFALRSKSVKKAGGHYGELFTPRTGASKNSLSILVPEVVRRGDLEIGRFEVTRAQFAAFDANYKFDPGTEDYPANSITFEQAKAYSSWLAKTTGKPFRLPESVELESLVRSSKGNENTLDYWAGYQVNPDDAARLKKAVEELGPPDKGPLLRPVGSFQPTGGDEDALIYDLGGNVAEWTVAKDGTGQVVGGSADTPSDPKIPASLRAPSPGYIGFRVFCGTSKITTAPTTASQ